MPSFVEIGQGVSLKYNSECIIAISLSYPLGKERVSTFEQTLISVLYRMLYDKFGWNNSIRGSGGEDF